MKMTGQERIAAPRSRVWEALNDPEVLRQCIPGCQSLERQAPDKLRAAVEIRIGPIGARFNSGITLSDIRPAQGYTLIGEGQAGTVGSARATIKVELKDDGASTLLSYDADAQVGGRLAQLGGPIIDATAKQFAGRFFRKFGEIVGGATAPSPLAEATGVGAVGARTAGPATRPAGSFPIAWILAILAAGFVGFFVGRGQSEGGFDWIGLAIGLLLVIVAAAGFEHGRRSAAPQVVLDAALLERLLRGGKQ